MTNTEARTKNDSSARTREFDALPDAALVNQKVLTQLYGCDRVTLWRMIRSGSHPAPLKLGVKMNVWPAGTIRAHLAALSKVAA